ncbi:hypothetical protein BJX66DRAFT_314527 [Aspergillus keveii]|uniref:BTB domain-containing protein n=1 Tax=Aspergillus keveii TaxID=714993 RepID=A0ABR4FQL6_9EURO
MEKPLGKLTLSAGIARINVGPDETPFDVHLELLCDSSPYFNNLYKDRTDSTISEVPITLPDVDPDVFAEAISWMYRGKLSADLSTRDRGMAFCFELWVLAAKFEIPALQNQAIGICKVRIDNSTATSLPSTQTVEYVYSNTKPGSPPRRLLVDVWSRRGTTPKFSDRKTGLPRAFLEDMCEALLDWACEKNLFVLPVHTRPEGEYWVDGTGAWAPDPSPWLTAAPAPAPAPQAEDSNSPRLATPAQMANRRMKSPSPRLSESSRKASGSPEVTGSSGATVTAVGMHGTSGSDVVDAIRNFHVGLKARK